MWFRKRARRSKKLKPHEMSREDQVQELRNRQAGGGHMGSRESAKALGAWGPEHGGTGPGSM